MLLGSKFKTNRARNLELAINDTIVENVSSQNILRICVDSNLTLHAQVHDVISKLNSKIALLNEFHIF
jgi:hypothetical protein